MDKDDFLAIAFVLVMMVVGLIVGVVVSNNIKPAEPQTIYDLYGDYIYGMKTPKDWDVSDWYKFKTETPQKALKYLEYTITRKED